MARPKLTAKYLREILNYDPRSGIFTWAIERRPSPFKPGDRAGCIAAKGHIAIRIDGWTYKAHRLAWLYMTGEWPKDQIDHMNGIPDDNRFENLRECNNAENCQNQGVRSNNTSGVHGVWWSKTHRKWQTRISVNMKSIHLGFFDSLEEAGAAYAKAKIKHHIDSPVFIKKPLKATS
jgi:hypothetical protein